MSEPISSSSKAALPAAPPELAPPALEGLPIDAKLLATMSDAELARTLRMSLAAFGNVADTVAHSPSSTIEPAQRASADPQGRRALEGLGKPREDHGIAGGLDVERTIGEGGMGIVRLATQRSLGRKVAVKTLREGVRSEAATLRLLREAWVTGTLEHPNIVPVYDLGLDDAGSPIIVLKRIEGVEWGEVMRDAKVARERFGADDLLEYNLRVLVQLCNAVSLAHARGVLHRDLKPENVMIGSFGEVYLVDWGIAVSLVADPLGRLPIAAEQNEMAGTPCYMAPEMLGALGKLSERTDVYLLGAVLHEILTGAPPHRGSFKQIVGSILLSTFSYGPDVSPDLAAIARRAMSRQPDDRFASADELRLRLEWYLRHRGSLAISAEATRRLEDMKSLVERERLVATDGAHDEIYRLFAECRFGFKQAVIASSDNETARSGLREAIAIVVRFELARGAAEAAAGVLAELDNPEPELAASVAEALRQRAADKKKMERLERLDADLDPAIGRRTRVAATGVLGVIWTIAPQLFGWLDRRSTVHAHWIDYLGSIAGASVGLATVVWGFESLTKTIVNRRMVATGALLFATQLALQVGAHIMGLGEAVTTTLFLAAWGGIMATFAATVDKRFWPSVIGFFVAFFVACRWQGLRWDAMSASNFVLLVTFLVAWWRPREDAPRFVERLRAERALAQKVRRRVLPASKPSGK